MRLEKACARLPGLEVVWVDQFNYHLFLPLLYQVATGGVDPLHVCFPVRLLLKNGGTAGPVSFLEGRVAGIDLGKRVVETEHERLDWDYLVLALGSTTSFFGLPDIEPHVMTVKTLASSIAIYNHMLRSYEQAWREKDEQRRRELLTFVVVGGGATGAELAGSLNGFVCNVMPRSYPPLAPLARVMILEASDSLLKGMDPGMGRVARDRLTREGVEVKLSTRVARGIPGGIVTADGQTIRAGTVIWVAGVTPVPLARALPLQKARDGRIIVEPTLQAPGKPEVYIIGDCAHVQRPGGGTAYPPTGQIAVRQGVHCARNIVSSLLGRPQAAFDYRYRGELISLGRNVAVAKVGKVAFDGFPAWVLWQTYYLRKLMGFRNRLGVLVDWAFDYFHRRNTARLE